MTISGTNSSPREWVFHASQVDHFHQVAHSNNSADFIQDILKICLLKKITHIIPLTDPEVDILSAQRHIFEDQGLVLCIPSDSAIRECRDKWRVFQTFKDSLTINVIPSFRVDDAIKRHKEFPLLAKPRTGRSSQGIVPLHTSDDFQYFQKKALTQDYILQPLLSGAVHVVDIVHHQSSGQWAATSRVELMRSSNGAGLTVQMTNIPLLNHMAVDVVRRLEINGCINIEFIQQESDFYLMDINPRFSAGVSFSAIHGYDMVKNHLYCHIKEIPGIDKKILNQSTPIITRHYIESVSSN